MIELPEKVTVVMYKDKNGCLHKTQSAAINSDNWAIKRELTEQLSGLLYNNTTISGYTVYDRYDGEHASPKNMSDIADDLLAFLSEEINDVLPIVQAYVRVKKAV